MSGASPQSSASHLLTFLVAQLLFLCEWKLSDRRLYEVFECRLLIWGNPKERNSPDYYPFKKHAFFLCHPVSRLISTCYVRSKIFQLEWLNVALCLFWNFMHKIWSWSRWLHSLRHGSAVACLQGSWVWFLLGAWMSIACECCVVRQRSALEWLLVQRSPTKCGVLQCDCEASMMRPPWPTRSCCTMGRGGEWRTMEFSSVY